MTWTNFEITGNPLGTPPDGDEDTNRWRYAVLNAINEIIRRSNMAPWVPHGFFTRVPNGDDDKTRGYPMGYLWITNA